MEPPRHLRLVLPPLPEAHPLFAREDWPLVRKMVRAAAYKLRPTLDEANELAHAAILTCLRHRNEPWRLPRKALVTWLIRCAANLSFNKRRHEEGFRDEPIAEEGGDELDDGTSYNVGHILRATGPTPEAAYLSAEAEAMYRRRLDALVERAKDDALVSLLVAEVLRDSDSPMAAAIAKGYSAEDIYNARKRLERAALAVLDDERKASPSSQEAP